MRLVTLLKPFLCALCFVFMSTAVADSSQESNTIPLDNQAFVIGFAQDDLTNDWRAAQVRDFRNALAAYPQIQIVVTDAQGQTARQIKDIEDLAQKNIDILVTSPRDAQAMTPVISQVYRSGIPVILLSRHILNEDYTVFIGASNRAIAQQAAHFFGEYADKSPLNILILQHIPSSTPGIERTQGFLDAIQAYPQIKVAAIKRADSLRAMAIQAVEQSLQENIEFNAIYAQSDSMASGARLALKHAGIDPATIPTIGVDYIGEARAAIQAGEQAASFTYPTFGAEGAEYALKILQGISVPKQITIPSVLVTKDNVNNIEPIF